MMQTALFEETPRPDANLYVGPVEKTFPPPRPFQVTAHESLRQGVREGHRCQVLMSATGSGKTYLGMMLISETLKKGRRCLFICDRTVLIDQTSAVADSYGLNNHGIIQRNHWRTDYLKPLQIASVQTLARRDMSNQEFDVVIVDEVQDQYKGWIDLMTLFPNAKFIGLSATPFSKGLGKLFTNLINAATMHQLTTEPDPTSGKPVLVPMRIFSCHKVNMEGAATRGGEWTDEGAAERGMEIIGDVVADWELYGKGRKTIVFGPTIAHCEKMKDWFVSRGHQAMTFTADTTPAERADILREYRKKDSGLDILISVAALAKGFDCPEVSCICDVRPLRKSLSTAIQMWGRGLRSAPDKTECLLLDFSGNIVRFADDFSDVYFNGLNQLHKGEKLDKKIRKDEEHIEMACPKCGYKPCGKRCVQCGFQKKKQSLEEHAPGVMKEIIIGGKKAADDNHHLYKQLVSFTRNSSSQKPREWAWNLYKQITGESVPKKWEGEFWMMPLCHVTSATKGKIQQLRIAYRHAIK
jgi:superfamily II DNA or RNA helicase